MSERKIPSMEPGPHEPELETLLDSVLRGSEALRDELGELRARLEDVRSLQGARREHEARLLAAARALVHALDPREPPPPPPRVAGDPAQPTSGEVVIRLDGDIVTRPARAPGDQADP